MKFLFGVFIVLHGFVHMLYFAQSRRLFELKTGMLWPDGSWALSAFFEDKTVRSLASVFCVLAAVGFAVGGLGILVGKAWWYPLIVGSSVFSTVLFILFWDGKMRKLDDQ
jgi:hypothetical protein